MFTWFLLIFLNLSYLNLFHLKQVEIGWTKQSLTQSKLKPHIGFFIYLLNWNVFLFKSIKWQTDGVPELEPIITGLRFDFHDRATDGVGY